jgi:hypothetical protein
MNVCENIDLYHWHGTVNNDENIEKEFIFHFICKNTAHVIVTMRHYCESNEKYKKILLLQR